MPFSKSRNYKRKSKKSRRKSRRPKQMSKSLKKSVTKLIDRKLDDAVEDKYILDTAYNSLVPYWDNGTKTVLINVTPGINFGDLVDERQGNKVILKSLKTFVKMIPNKVDNQHDAHGLGVSSYAQNMFRRLPRVRCFLIRINRELGQSITNTELRTALNAKFRTSGHWWNDYQESTGQRALSGVKLLKKFSMK